MKSPGAPAPGAHLVGYEEYAIEGLIGPELLTEISKSPRPPTLPAFELELIELGQQPDVT